MQCVCRSTKHNAHALPTPTLIALRAKTHRILPTEVSQGCRMAEGHAGRTDGRRTSPARAWCPRMVLWRTPSRSAVLGNSACVRPADGRPKGAERSRDSTVRADVLVRDGHVDVCGDEWQ